MALNTIVFPLKWEASIIFSSTSELFTKPDFIDHSLAPNFGQILAHDAPLLCKFGGLMPEFDNSTDGRKTYISQSPSHITCLSRGPKLPGAHLVSTTAAEEMWVFGLPLSYLKLSIAGCVNGQV